MSLELSMTVPFTLRGAIPCWSLRMLLIYFQNFSRFISPSLVNKLFWYLVWAVTDSTSNRISYWMIVGPGFLCLKKFSSLVWTCIRRLICLLMVWVSQGRLLVDLDHFCGIWVDIALAYGLFENLPIFLHSIRIWICSKKSYLKN